MAAKESKKNDFLSRTDQDANNFSAHSKINQKKDRKTRHSVYCNS